MADVGSLLDLLKDNEHFKAVKAALGVKDDMKDLEGSAANYQTHKPGESLKGKLDSIEAKHAELKNAEKALEKAEAAAKPAHEASIKKLKETLHDAAGHAHAELDDLVTNTNKLSEKAKEHVADLEEKIGKLSGKNADEAAKTLAEEKAKLDKLLNKSSEVEKTARPKIKEMTGREAHDAKLQVNTSNFTSTAAKVGKDGKRIALGETKWNELGKYGKFKEATLQAWSHGGIMRRTGAVAGTGVGAIIVGKGLKNLGRFVGMASPEQDETGKDIPADVGTLVKSVAQLAGGGAVAYFALTAGGKGHALSK